MNKSEITSIILESVDQLREYIGKLRDELRRAYKMRDAESVVYYTQMINNDSTNEADVPDFNQVFKHTQAYVKWKKINADEIENRIALFNKARSATTSPASKVNEPVAEGDLEEKPFSMEESSPPGFPKALHDKLVSQYGKTPKAYATMWKIHDKKNEGNSKITEMWIEMEGKMIPEVGATFATNCPAPEEKPELAEEKEDFFDGLHRELKNAERKKDAEKAVYYRQAINGNYSAVAGFDKAFRGSAAYEFWKQKNAKAIADQEKEFKRFSYTSETGNLFDPGMLENVDGNVVNKILQALIDRKNSLRPQEENLHQGLMAAIDVVRKLQQGNLHEGIFSNGRGTLYSTEMFYIKELLELDVKVEFEFHGGTNQPDDPGEVDIKEILSEEEIPESSFHDVHEPSEIKLISAIKIAVKSLYPDTKPGILIPKGADFFQINKKLKNYLDTDIEKLQETLFEKMTKY